METSTRVSDSTTGAGETLAASRQPQTYTRKATGLVREVRLADMFAFNGAAATPVAALLAIVVFAILASFPGANLVLDIVLAGVLLPFIWVTFSLMSAAMPGQGGDYLYGSRVLHPVVGLFSNLATYSGALLSVGLTSFFFVNIGLAPTLNGVGVIARSKGWLDAATTVSSHGWTLLISGFVLVLISVLSLAGTKIIARTMAWGYYLALAGVLVSLLVLLFTSRHHFVTTINNVSRPYTHTRNTYAATVSAGAKTLAYPNRSGYSTTATLGALFLAVINVTATFYGVFLAGEMKGGGKRSRQLIAQAGSGYFQLLVMLIGVLILTHTAGYNFMDSASNGNYGAPAPPYFTFFASAVIGSPVVALLIGLSFMAAIPPWIYGNLGLCQRVPFALALDGILPKKVGEVNRRTHTPVVAIVISMILGLGCLVYAVFAKSFIQVLAYTAVPAVVPFVIVGFAAAVMKWRRPELYHGSSADWRIRGVPVLPLAGAGCSALGVFLFSLVVRFHSNVGIVHAWSEWLLIGGIAVVALTIYLSAKITRRRQGVDISLAYRTLPID